MGRLQKNKILWITLILCNNLTSFQKNRPGLIL
jgi:hypothetical protein